MTKKKMKWEVVAPPWAMDCSPVLPVVIRCTTEDGKRYEQSVHFLLPEEGFSPEFVYMKEMPS